MNYTFLHKIDNEQRLERGDKIASGSITIIINP